MSVSDAKDHDKAVCVLPDVFSLCILLLTFGLSRLALLVCWLVPLGPWFCLLLSDDDKLLWLFWFQAVGVVWCWTACLALLWAWVTGWLCPAGGQRRWLIVCSHNVLSLVQHEFQVPLFGRFGHVGWVSGPNLGDSGWGGRVPVLAGPPILCCGEGRHRLLLGVGPGLWLGLVHLESLGLFGQLEGFLTLLGLGSVGGHLGLDTLYD